MRNGSKMTPEFQMYVTSEKRYKIKDTSHLWQKRMMSSVWGMMILRFPLDIKR